MKAGHNAYRTTLERTGAVTVTVKTSNGQLVGRQRDGSSGIIKNLLLGRCVKPGTVLRRVK